MVRKGMIFSFGQKETDAERRYRIIIINAIGVTVTLAIRIYWKMCRKRIGKFRRYTEVSFNDAP